MSPPDPGGQWGRHLVALVVVSLLTSSCAVVRPVGPGRSVTRLDSHLRAAEAAWPEASRANPSAEALIEYNTAVEQVLDDIQRDRDGIPWAAPIQTPTYRLSFEPGRINSPFREIYNLTKAIPARTVVIKHARRRAATDGLGVPAVMVRERDAVPAKTSPFVPLNGRWLPATFVIDFSKPGRPVGQFYNSRHTETASIGGHRHPLATDFSAGLELSLGSGFLRKLALTGLLKPAAHLQKTGLYITETFNPRRIPVIMIHGLASDPHIWQNPMNEILADPVLRDRYQLWYFLYPTGLPVPASSARLRGAIRSSLESFDPEHDDAALRHMVLIGHSMGGLLTRMQVIDSGDDLWSSMFTVPPSQLNVSARTRRRLEPALKFKHLDEAERAIFVATPHRGSEVADWKPVRWVVNLIRLPLDIVDTVTDVARVDISFLNPDIRSFDAFGTRSVDNLSPRHPLLKAIEKRPIQVPYHSIIGNRGRSGPLEKSSDGVVPYWSSHLEGAQSETIVPAPHSCVGSPETAAEIVRILHEHLRKVEGGRRRSR